MIDFSKIKNIGDTKIVDPSKKTFKYDYIPGNKISGKNFIGIPFFASYSEITNSTRFVNKTDGKTPQKYLNAEIHFFDKSGKFIESHLTCSSESVIKEIIDNSSKLCDDCFTFFGKFGLIGGSKLVLLKISTEEKDEIIESYKYDENSKNLYPGPSNPLGLCETNGNKLKECKYEEKK